MALPSADVDVAHKLLLRAPRPFLSGCANVLFNSPEFLLAFLPITMICTAITLRVAGRRARLICLGAASLFFYGYWEVTSLAIIGLSIAWNFGLSHLVARSQKPSYRFAFMWLGIAGNLAALGYYKYANFLLANVAPLLGAQPSAVGVALPWPSRSTRFSRLPSWSTSTVEKWTESHSQNTPPPSSSFLT